MKKRISYLIMLVTIAIPLTTLANIPDISHSYTEMAYQGPETVSLFSLPDGSGHPFTEAYLPDGTIIDATITLYILDTADYPIEGFPSEDMWLNSTDDNFILCTGGSNPESHTDANGMTTWAQPMQAGGYNMENINVYINGEMLNDDVPLNMHNNSADINGDLTVDLLDVSLFSADFYSAYHYQSDFHCDGSLDLLDVTKLAQGLRATCP